MSQENKNQCYSAKVVKDCSTGCVIRPVLRPSGPITSWETVETVSDFIFWAPKSLQMVTAAMKLKDAYSLEEKL